MDALQLLRDDHEKVRALFRQFKDAHENDAVAEMGNVAAEIFTELKVHTQIEEQVFYPAVQKEGDEELNELVREGLEEHHVVDILIEELENLDASDEAFAAKMTVLIENVEHHADEEESEMFPQTRDALGAGRLQELGARLEEAKRTAQESQGEAKATDEATKEELYKKAQEQEIPGRSTMSKDELAKAVRTS